MKKIVSFIICVALVLALSASAFAEASPASLQSIGMKCDEATFLRSQANTTSPALGQFNPGEFFWCVGSGGGSWYYGYADENSAIYRYYGEKIYGYVDGTYFHIEAY